MYNFFFFISWIFILINNVDSYPRWRTSSTDNYPTFPIRHGFLYPTEPVPTTTQLTGPFDWTTTTTIDEFYEDQSSTFDEIDSTRNPLSTTSTIEYFYENEGEGDYLFLTLTLKTLVIWTHCLFLIKDVTDDHGV
jgi:hypothetical protein